MKHKVLHFALTFFFGFLFSATIAFAQVTGGAVTGSVVDANKAVIPNATVKLTDKLRGTTFSTQTTDTGSYLFPNVSVGEFTLSIEQTNFAAATQDVKVALNQTTTVDITLQATSIGATVDVTTTSEAIVQTDSSQLGKSFDTRKVLDLPIGGNPNNLALLAPNVVTVTAGTAGAGGTVGGVRPRGNAFNIDGVDNNDAGVTGPSTGVIQDAVEEFTLLQNNYNAEFGAGAGGQFNTITKSGTNGFHGSAFSYLDSQKFNARSTGEDGRKKDLFKQVRYGGTLGGPIVKNKLFFFGAYQRVFLDQAQATAPYTAPTAAGLAQIAAIPGVSPFVINLLRDNLTLAPTADAASTRDFGTVLGVSGIPFGTVTLPVPGSKSQHSFQINVDHNPNDKNQFRYRFGFDRQRLEQPGSGALKFNNLLSFDSRLFSANWIRTFGSNLVNDLRLSYRTTNTSFPLKDSAFDNFPNVTVDSLNVVIGPSGNLPQGTPLDQNYQVYDSLTYSRGNHTFRFGGDVRRLIQTGLFLPRARGDYDYSNLNKLLQDIQPDSVNIRGVGSAAFEGDHYLYSFFGQDDWKVRPNLTLNLGLRYEYVSLPKGAATQELNNVASVPGVIEFNRPKTDKNNFAPRIGFAYSPTWNNTVGRFFFGRAGESSIRANFAMAHFVNFLNLLQLNLPPQFQQEINGGGSETQFLQNGGIPNVLAPVNTPELARAATSSFIVDQTVPYSLSYALSYQRQLTRNMGIEFRFLSTHARKLPIQTRLNNGLVNRNDFVLPTFFSDPTAAQLVGLRTLADVANNSPTVGVGALQQFGFEQNVTAFTTNGKSDYNGASVSLTRRFTRDFGFTASYTFSKTLDDATNELNTSALNPRRAQDAFNIGDEYGLSALDIPHRFVASFNYELPYFNNSQNLAVRTLLGGWSANGIFQAQSGQPITIRSGIDSNLNGDAAGDRAVINPNGTDGVSSKIRAIGLNAQGQIVELDLGDDNTLAYVAVNPNARYVVAGYLTSAATAGRNTLRTRGFNQTDAVLLKNTRFGRDNRFNFQIGAEINDLFNQRPRNLGLPSLTLGVSGVGSQTGAFGIAGNAKFNDYTLGNYSGRTVTVRGKFIF